MKGSRCARRRARPGLSRSLYGDAESGCISRSTSERLVYIVSYRRSVSPLQRATSPVAHTARRVYVTLRCPSVCLFHLSTSAAASGGFAAVGPACGRYRSIAARPAHSSTAVSSKCEQCHVCSRRRRLSSDLFDSSNTSRTSLRHEVDTLAGRSSRVVSASDCGVRGPGFESHCRQLCLSRQPLRYTALGTGCAALLQCLGRLSLSPSEMK